MSRRSGPGDTLQDDLQVLLGRDVEDGNDKKRRHESDGQAPILRELVRIRNVLIGVLSIMMLTLIGACILGVFLWNNSDPIVDSIAGGRMIIGRVNSLLEPDSDIHYILSNASLVSGRLTGMQAFAETLLRNELVRLLAGVLDGLTLIDNANSLLTRFSIVDPTDFYTFAENNRLAERTVRIIVAVNDLLNRLDDPETQTSIDTMTVEALTLISSIKTLLDSMHETGITVKL